MSLEYWQELMRERAAIREYMGNVPRERAEREAKLEIEALRRQHNELERQTERGKRWPKNQTFTR